MKAYDLRALRRSAGLSTQSDLSNLLGCNTETIGDIELGRIGIDDETYETIRAAINKFAESRQQTKEVAA